MFLEANGAYPFEDWLGALRDRVARGRLRIRLKRLSAGNPGFCRPVGEGVHELKIDYGPGYRVYFANDGDELAVILGVARRAITMPKRVKDYQASLLASLRDPVESEHYIEAALEDSDEMFLSALRDVAEANEMAKKAGVARETLYRMLSTEGNLTYRNLKAILDALDLRLRVTTKNRDYG